MKTEQQILHVQRAFLYNLYENDVNFLLRRCLAGVNTGANSISSLSANLGAVPKTLRQVYPYLPF